MNSSEKLFQRDPARADLYVLHNFMCAKVGVGEKLTFCEWYRGRFECIRIR